MIYNNTISDIESSIFEPWRICGEYKDGFSVTVGGNDEEDCMQRLIDLQEKHGDLNVVFWLYGSRLCSGRIYQQRKFYL